MRLFKGDCFEMMQNIPDCSIDMILCDLPYGNKTGFKWDSKLPLNKIWESYKRIITKNGIIALFAVEPFTSYLVMSNIEMFRYKWVWQKEQGSNWQLAKIQPLNVIEDICIFSFGKSANGAKLKANYFPIIVKRDTISKSGGKPSSTDILHKNSMVALHKVYETAYPTNILKFNRVHSSARIHPTQKPVALLEYLIRTYTNENDMVLDNCFGSCSTGVACVHTHRDFIGIEKNEEFFKKGKDWLLKEIDKQGLFSGENNGVEIKE